MTGRNTFSALAPVLDPYEKLLAVSFSSTFYGGQHDTTYVKVLHATYVRDERWGFMLGPARTYEQVEVVVMLSGGKVEKKSSAKNIYTWSVRGKKTGTYKNHVKTHPVSPAFSQKSNVHVCAG